MGLRTCWSCMANADISNLPLLGRHHMMYCWCIWLSCSQYGEPYHGVAIIKAHDPLTFTLNQLTDLMAVSDGWFTAAARHYTAIRRSESSVTETPSAEAAAGVAAALPPRPVSAPPGVAAAVAAMPEPWPHKSRRPLHPFFIWNALARAGTWQFPLQTLHACSCLVIIGAMYLHTCEHIGVDGCVCECVCVCVSHRCISVPWSRTAHGYHRTRTHTGTNRPTGVCTHVTMHNVPRMLTWAYMTNLRLVATR